jgi:mRNA interferase MazF
VVVVPLSSNLRLTEAPGNVLIPVSDSRLGRDLVANVAHPLTLERRWLRETPGRVGDPVLGAIANGLRLVLDL